MIIRVDADAAVPVYEQIREQVVRMVHTGTLPVGARLPTIRQLASDLRLAKGTVAKSYSMLEAHGVVESRGHKGTFVLDPANSQDRDTATMEAELRAAADGFVVVARQLGADRDEMLRATSSAWDELGPRSD